jgi:hypothetical protein
LLAPSIRYVIPAISLPERLSPPLPTLFIEGRLPLINQLWLQLQPLFAITGRSVPKCNTHSRIQRITPVQSDVIFNVFMTIVAHPPLFWSALRFSDVQQQRERVIDNEVEASAIARIGSIAKWKVLILPRAKATGILEWIGKLSKALSNHLYSLKTTTRTKGIAIALTLNCVCLSVSITFAR